MSVVESAVKQAKEVLIRAANIIDAFRPKILFTGNIAEFLEGQRARPLARRLGSRILGGRREESTTTRETSGLIVEEKEEAGEKKQTFIY